MGDYFNKKDQHKNLREFDRLLEDRVVRFTHDNDISTFLKDSKELLNQFCPPTYNMFLLLSAT